VTGDVIHEIYLPFTADSMREHFLLAAEAGAGVEKYTRAWAERVAQAGSKDPAFLARDETMWTAAALVAIHRSETPKQSWIRLLSDSLGGTPPFGDGESWDSLLGDEDLNLYFEVGLRSPARYREWLSQNLATRHPLSEQRDASADRGIALEGRTHLDALLLAPSTGFRVHFEAKVLSDIDTKTKHDALRNQLARNLDCMWDGSGVPSLPRRESQRSVLLLLTPELFRQRRTSRLYGNLFDLYREDPAALHGDLPHLEIAECEHLSKRLGWITFEQVRDVEPGACRWLPAS